MAARMKNLFVTTSALLALLAAGLSAAEDPETWKWNDPKELRLPGLRHETIEGASMKRTVGYCIYLPPQYEQEPERRFPVVFFLHGAGGTESSDAPGFARLVQAEVTAGTIAPVIYVFPQRRQDQRLSRLDECEREDGDAAHPRTAAPYRPRVSHAREIGDARHLRLLDGRGRRAATVAPVSRIVRLGGVAGSGH